MKLNMPLMHLIIRMLILMILFIIIYLISAILYSTKYWPDIYNYINANITIKRIPKLSELNVTDIEYFTEDPTEIYTTTEPEFVIEISTIDEFDIDEFTNFDKDFRYKRDIPIIDFNNDYSELPKKGIIIEHMDWTDVNNQTNNETMSQNVTDTEFNNDTVHIDLEQLTEKNNTSLRNDKSKEDYCNNSKKQMAGDESKNTKHNTTLNKFSGSLIDKNVNNIDNNNIDIPINDYAKHFSNDDIMKDAEEIMNDSINDSELTTRTEDVEMVTGVYKFLYQMNPKTHDSEIDVEPFISWIATIFVANQTSEFQYYYICDGVFISENIIMTSARCVHRNNEKIEPKDFLINLGKKNLQSSTAYEKITRIKHVIVHENFTNDGRVENDLAILVMEEPVTRNEGINVANISVLEDFDAESNETATTAWSPTGAITPIYYIRSNHSMCTHMKMVENTFCATYGNDVALCPSYGGAYAAKIEAQWYLQGIFFGDPADRGFCFRKSVLYTSLKNYLWWITDIITSY